MGTSPSIGFQELADSREFAEFFELARNLTGILVALIDPSGQQVKRLFPPSAETRICQLIQSTARGRVACHDTDLRHCERAAQEKHSLHYRCHAGMVDMAVPIFIGGRHIATMNCGQMLAEPPSPEGLRRLLARGHQLGVDSVLLREAYARTPYLAPAQLQGSLQLFTFFAQYFCDMSARLHRQEDSERADIGETLRFLQRHFRESLSLPDIARQAELSPSYFCTCFKRETGRTVTEYLHFLRIEESKHLLETTPQTVTEIALQVGFNNLTHFTRVFRAQENTSPGSYRKKVSGGGQPAE